MKTYTCDYCGNVATNANVTLNGVTGSGGILLPERLMKKHFCSTVCFWTWAEKYIIHSVIDED